MPISVNNDIGPIIERRIPALIDRFPKHETLIRKLRADFFELFGDRYINEMKDGEFCKILEPWINANVDDEELAKALHEERLLIWSDVMKILGTRFAQVSLRDVAPSLQFNRDGSIPSRPRKSSEQISKIVMEYAALAAFLGTTEAFDILVMLGILSPGERADALSFIASYLGESGPNVSNGGEIVDILRSEERILKNVTVFEKMRVALIRHCYQKLMDEEADTLENQPQSLETIESWIRTQLNELYSKAFQEKSEKVSTTHKDLYNGVVNHFKAAAALKIPEYMNKTTHDHNGKEWPLGSWRQRLALVDMLNPEQRHAYIAIDAGGGKTFTYLWGFELAKEERKREKLSGRARMLILSTKAIISEIPNRIRKGSAPKETDALYYPDPDKAPTVGVIRAGMKPEEIREAASKDIVFCAYSMWHRSRTEDIAVEGEIIKDMFSIEDLLINQEEPFTSLAFDEAHLLQGDGEYTRLARETIRGIPNLYTKGHIFGGSGTPAPGRLNGLRVVLELFEKPKNRSEKGERKEAQPNHWSELRRMLGKLWKMDKPEEWMNFVEYRPYDLSEEEKDLLRLIVEDNTIDAQNKLQLLLLVIRCPRLMSSDPQMRWTSTEQTKKAISELLNVDGRSSILVTENMRASGVLRPTDDDDLRAEHRPEDYFFQNLQTWCIENTIEFYVIHGGIKEDERIEIYEKMKMAKQEGRKCITYAHSACLNLGIDLTECCDGIVSQQWPYNTPDLYQLLKRVLRRGNTNCRMIVLGARETVEQGIYTSAQHKYADVMRCLLGLVLSDKRMEELSDDPDGVSDQDVARRIESSEQQWEHISRALHGQGSSGIKEFWDRSLEEFIMLLDQKEHSSIGDDDRVIASIVLEMEQSGMLPQNGQYLHTCSFGQRLRDFLSRSSSEHSRVIRSMDATQSMLDYGGIDQPAFSGNITGTPADLLKKVQDGEIQKGVHNLVVLQGLEQTTHAQTEALQYTGRLRALKGATLALKSPNVSGDGGGILMIPLPIDVCSKDQMKALSDELAAFGLEVVVGYTGLVTSQDNEGEPAHNAYMITARKVVDFDDSMFSSIRPASLTLTLSKPKIAKKKYRNRKLPYSLPHKEFKLGRKNISLPIELSQRDSRLEYLDRLTTTVAAVRSLASSSGDFIKRLRHTDVMAVLKNLDVQCFPQFSTSSLPSKKKGQEERRLAFRFIGVPYLFYPFDKQWEVGEETDQ